MADQHVAYFYPSLVGDEEPGVRSGVNYFPYRVRPDFMNVTDVDYLVDHEHEFDKMQFDRVILELPALINNQIPTYLVKTTTLSVLVVDVNSPWGRTEKQLLDMYTRITRQPVLTVLDRVDVSDFDGGRRTGRIAPPTQQERLLESQRDDV